MRRSRLFACALLGLLTVVAQAGLVVGAESVGTPYIVVFDEAAVSQPAKGNGPRNIDRQEVNRRVTGLQTALKVKPKNVFGSAVGGFSADLSPGQLRQLQQDPAVAFVVPDEKIALDIDLAADGGIASIKTTTSQALRMPAGVVRVGATKNSIASINGTDQRVDADIAILDTGVDKSHTDLNVVGGYNCTTSNRSAWGDEHGHGTHVAGTAAARDNSFGVVGVAPGARIWSVKVLNKEGTGYLSWLVCGIDWVTAQKDASAPSGQLIEVANMSLRFSLKDADNRDCGIPAKDAVHQAICRSVAAGVVYAVAGGNDQRNVKWYRPAAYPSVITVSAIVDYDGKPGGLADQADYCSFYSKDPDDTFAKFSNFGKLVDMTAPGKCVVSTYPGNRYAWMSGTSMATPHVAGGAALYMVRYPNAKPQQVRMALQHVGLHDWRISTDPDKWPDKLLWVGSHIAPPEFTMSASAPSGWLGNGSRVPVSISRTAGHTAPISLSLTNAPAGLTGSGTITGSSGNLTLHVQPGTASGVHKVTVRATDGELVRTRQVDLRIDGAYPTAVFKSPTNGLTVQSSSTVVVSWDEADVGSGVQGRTVQRQRATIKTPGTCDGVSWSNVGTPYTQKSDWVQSVKSDYCFRWRLSVSDNAGNVTTTTSGAVIIDSTGADGQIVAPALTEPTFIVRAGSKVKADSTIRLEVRWTATSASGVSGHQLRVSTNGGSSWSSAPLGGASKLSGTSPMAVVLLKPGSNYRLSARSSDGSGNWSEWVTTPTFDLQMTQGEAGAVGTSGSWTTKSVAKTLAGQVRFSKQPNAKATFTFTGRELAIVGFTRPKGGRAEVYVNGKLQTTIDTRSSSKVKRKIVFNRTWASSATRTVEVVVLGTTDRPRVDIDAFIVLR
jgi:subtilisin